jgi:hypothetical protein
MKLLTIALLLVTITKIKPVNQS